eukprot:gb/GECG01001117.1/.p1 GENE.gb/GECG01001117.1/~~gb/GECG01001117.1/.p1  ORF type:complete len:565 (+),score=74.60 gb/GECG01001117.1/:1-1695(+)
MEGSQKPSSNASPNGEITLTVSWGKSRAEVQVVPTLDVATFCSDVIRAQPGWEDIKVSKVLSKGHAIQASSQSTLQDVGIQDGANLKLFGSRESCVEQIKQVAKNRERELNILDDRNDRSEEIRRKLAPREKRPKFVPAKQYGFEEIQEIPTLPDSDTARDLLATIAMDPGVRAVMEHNRFKVDRLTEMYPEGKVGVSPTCVLGYNTGKGKEISLRLRTDDLRGFRPYDKILSVLWHELAHNVYGEHNADFYKLNHQLEKQGRELDWRKTQGYRLGGFSASAPEDSTGQRYHINAGVKYGRQKLDFEKYQPFTATLSRERRPNTSPRVAAAEAALKRHHDVDTGRNSASTETESMLSEEKQQFFRYRPPAAPNKQASEGGTIDLTSEQAPLKDESDGVEIVETNESTCGDATSRPNEAVSHGSVLGYYRAGTEESDTDMGNNSEGTDATYQRLQHIRQTVNEFVAHCMTFGYNVCKALETIHLLINNALIYSDVPKYRRFRWSNGSLQRRLGGKPASVQTLLRTAGFQPDSYDSDYWTFKGDDVASSWLVRDVVEQRLHLLNSS